MRRRFHRVYWIPPTRPIDAPAVFVPNHHGWFDGYLMYLAVKELGIPTLDWIQEYDAFPLFGRIGGLPYPLGDAARRLATVRKSIRLMNSEGWSLLLFAEAELHRPSEIREFGKALDTVASHVPQATIIPVSILYQLSLHERPEAFILIGDPVERGDDLRRRTRAAVEAGVERLKDLLSSGHPFEVLAEGTPDVNERWDFRKLLRK